ncbi:CRISPR-associated RAMP protein [Saccharolobus solfataricus]|nr:CRISPR-associated RAMP protein [Saccharolobus solfataricus]8BMW_F Chain F, CRISPR-associated Cas7 paralog (Type III-D) [Saccharolobus solfataricus]8BMW_G Chain G, CRISPR-associated Cas7 paralog (Type III-D) [Saccharolobus solfataricus]SAI85103.1 CRISPR-associated Cas7 paralog (Type III-D) [Saccharolobus solfataricus]
MSCMDLDVITTVVKIEGKLRNETLLRVGKGKTQDFAEATDNPIIKYRDRPLIPGSSLKGAFRSLVESYTKSLNDSKYYVCDLDDNSCVSCEEKKKDNGIVEGRYCIPCILFGFKDLASRVYILDAIAEKYSISQRTMVAINRVFGGQMPGHLYTLDYVDPGSEFSFMMMIYNLNLIEGEKDWKAKSVEALKFLLATLVREGIFVGARKSVGYGLIKLVDAKVSLYKAPDHLVSPVIVKKLEEVIGTNG